MATFISTLAAVSTLLLAQSVAGAETVTIKNSSYTTVYTVTQDTGANVPLFSKRFQWPNLPYKADSGDGPRGTMQGYNICNSTTLGPNSQCATLHINGPDDFCIWASPDPNELVGNVEGEMVAACTNAKYGSRVLPPGAISGLQYITTPHYIEIIGFIDQTALNLKSDDYGGEEDPHGADGRGNALGGLLYSSAFGQGIQQVPQWNYFVGSGIFCFKACNPNTPDSWNLCNNVYDRSGCTYNMPANYNAINGTFQSCKGDDQLPVGVYVTNGKTSTWYQPGEEVTNFSPPYQPFIPGTSSCTNYNSSSLFASMAAYASANPPNTTSSSRAAANTSAPSVSVVVSNGVTSTITRAPGNAANAGSTASAAAKATSTTPNSASRPVASGLTGLLLVGLAAVFLL
ncbi:hypothetical protein EMMF5_003760 [Cystobasidiomycetes sp. EMM_F5]